MPDELQRIAGLGPFVCPGLAAVLVGLSRQRIYALIAAGRLETEAVCGATFVLVSSLIRFREERQRLAERVKPRQLLVP